MGWLDSINSWLTGGSTPYMTLLHCMSHDTLWISITVTLDLLVATGYCLIVLHWWRNQQMLPLSPARDALGNMRNIFMFCGICGYLFIPIKMFWPAWRLYDGFMLVLLFFTWRYALNAKDLRVIYTAIGRTNQLAEDLAKSQDESKRKSFFLNAISHDLRTPLNGLLLHANLAEMSAVGGDADAARESIVEIKNCARHTAELLDGLLEFARLESVDDSANESIFDLDPVLRELRSAHAPSADRKSLKLSIATNTGLSLCTDRLKLERVLNNLLSNAIKFTSSGSVSVELEGMAANFKLHVSDTGVGIAPADAARLFEEFFQVQNHERDRQKGFGLGLAISRRLVRRLGGTLEVDSAPGRGSRFTVVLPAGVVVGRSAESSAVGSNQSQASAQSQSIRDTAAGAAG